jgi:hypothetical protein
MSDRATSTADASHPSVKDLTSCASRHMTHYVEARAFNAYDRVGDPRSLSPTDCLAPNLLSMKLGWRDIVPMFTAHAGDQPSPHAVLYEAMAAVLTADPDSSVRFEDLDLEEAGSPWSVVRAAMAASEPVRGLTAVAVSKTLHRKRPHLVPIYDSEVFRYYLGRGPSGKRAPKLFWSVVHQDVRDSGEFLAALGAGLSTPDGREVSALRLLDIVVWEHRVTACAGEA